MSSGGGHNLGFRIGAITADEGSSFYAEVKSVLAAFRAAKEEQG